MILTILLFALAYLVIGVLVARVYNVFIEPFDSLAAILGAVFLWPVIATIVFVVGFVAVLALGAVGRR